MLRCTFIIVQSIALVLFIILLLTTCFTNKEIILNEKFQYPQETNFTLKDSPLGVTWFLQVTDIHLGLNDDIYPSFKFKNILFS